MAEGGHIEIGNPHDSGDEMRQRVAAENAPRNVGAERYLAQIAENTERVAESTEIPKLPEHEEDQRKLITKYVEQIESNDAPVASLPNLFSQTNESAMRVVNALLANEHCNKEIKREATARLRLQHCFAVATAIPGRSQDAAIFLMQSFQQAESKKWALEGTDFTTLTKEIPGLKVDEAFHLLQMGYIDGIGVGGERIKLGDDKQDSKKIDAAYARLEQILGGNREARKSIQLAYRIAKATLETSVWNVGMAGNDPIAEAIYFETYRSKRLSSARDRGPDITVKRIKGFGTSYFRSVQTLDQIEIPDPENPGQMISYSDGRARPLNSLLFLAQPTMHPAYLTRLPVQERLLKIQQRNRLGVKSEDGQDISKRINLDDLDFSRIKGGDYAGWLGIMVPRILSFKSLLLQTTWKPEDVNSDNVEGWIAPSDTADPEEVQRLRPELVVGILGSILSEPEEAAANHWDNIRIKGMMRTLTSVFKTDRGSEPAFISEEQRLWVYDVLKEYGINVEHVASMIGVRQIISKRGIDI